MIFFMQSQNLSFFPFHLLHDGGLFFMTPILVMLLLVFFLIVKNILGIKKEKKSSEKYVQLINSIGLMTLVWGVLGQLIGLVSAFDKIELIGEVSTPLLAGGLKVSALPTMFGCLVFVVSRMATTMFIWIQKENDK